MMVSWGLMAVKTDVLDLSSSISWGFNHTFFTPTSLSPRMFGFVWGLLTSNNHDFSGESQLSICGEVTFG